MSQRLIVMKFGGTSVGSAARFRQCAEISRHAADSDKIIVVVSAVSGVTDLIFRSIEAARRGDAASTETNVKQFEHLHTRLIHELFSEPHSGPTLEFARRIFEQFRNSCNALLALGSDIAAQTYDALAALGERISARVLADYIRQTGTACSCVERVIVTDNTFGNAVPDMHATAETCAQAVLPLVERGNIVVAPGYSGITKDGQITTLGRGGSDYSATILGAAAGADEVWIWTDVDGVLSADPRICADATTLPEISFAEAVELAYYGAKVIHPKAAYPAMKAGIPVWIKNSFRPEVPGTRITHDAASMGSPVKAVTCVTNASLITLVSGRDVHPAELFGRLFLRLGQECIDTLFATQSSPEHALGLVLRKEDSARVVKLIQNIFRMELAQGVLNPVSVQNDIGVIAVLGESMKGTCGILGRVFSAVANCEVSVIAVAQGASELSICFAVNSAACPAVVRVLHSEFCTGADFGLRSSAAPAMATASEAS